MCYLVIHVFIHQTWVGVLIHAVYLAGLERKGVSGERDKVELEKLTISGAAKADK